MHAYGLVIADIATPNGLVGERRQEWHPLRMEQRRRSAVGDLDRGAHRRRRAGRSRLPVDPRLSSRSVDELTSPRPVPEDQIVHPLLGFAGAVAAHWAGRVALHAGAVLVDGQALIVLGAPGSGKSTLMSALNAAGFPVLSEDLAVIERRTVFAGPRTATCATTPTARPDGGPPRVTAPHEPGGARTAARARRGADQGVRVTGLGRLGLVLPAGPRREAPPADGSRCAAAGRDRSAAWFTLVELPMWQLVRPRRWQGLRRRCGSSRHRETEPSLADWRPSGLAVPPC